MRRLIVCLAFLFCANAHAVSYVVSKTADSNDGTCNSDCSWREAVNAANADGVVSTITFNPTVFAAPRKTITVPAGTNLTQNATVTGPTAGVLLFAAGNYNVLSVLDGASVSLDGLSFSGGNTGLENHGTVTLTNCTLSGSTYGFLNYGDTATLTNCTLSGNSNEGIVNGSDGGSGGSGRFGSGRSLSTVLTSTVSLTNCTITGNGTGINNTFGNTASVKNSIVAGNSLNTDGDPVTDGGNNILTGTAAEAGLDPEGLQDNGGPTETIALVSGSAAIDAASDANAPAKDERGYARPQGAHSDIGAYEAKRGLVIRDTAANEGNSGTTNLVFTVKLLLPAATAVTVDYATADGTANAASDYTAKSGTVTIPAGATSATITVPVKGDTTIEPDETFTVNLSNAVNAPILDSQGVGTIIGDDFEAPSLVVNTTSGVESKTDGVTSLPDAITYANSNADQSDITFSPTVFAAARKTITVGSVLTLSENVTITGPAAGVTIEGANQPDAIISVKSGKSAGFDGLTISKGVYGLLNQGTATLTNCTLSNNSDTGFYNYYGGATITSCTLSGNNFGVLSTGGTADLTNCTLSGNNVFAVSTYSCSSHLTNCTVSGNVGGLKNDYAGYTLRLKNSIVAGNTTNTDGPLLYVTNNIAAGTAAEAGLETDGTGQPILKDNDGPTKTIALVPGGAAIDAASDADAPSTDQRGYTRPQGTHSDIGAFELAPMVLVISDVTAKEGNSGTRNFVFTVKLLRSSVNAVTVDYATADDTASAGSDYTAKSGTLTIPAGAYAATITVPVKGDTTIEPDETFFVNLSNAVNATISDAQGVGTISTEDFETPSLVVNTTSDVIDNTDGVNSLREAIAYANSNPDQSTITFNIPIDQQQNGVWDININSALVINENTIITGPGPEAYRLRILENDSNKSFAILEADKNISLTRLELSNAGTGLANPGTGTATLTNCIMDFNATGVYNKGTANLTNCILSENSGNGIYNDSAGTTTFTGCTMSNNANGIVSYGAATVMGCTLSGGSNGIVSFGSATVSDCTLSGSSSNGIQIGSGTGTVTGCTMSGNSGIGFLNIGMSTVTNCTMSGNNIGILGNSGTVTVSNCTVTGNTNTGFINISPATLNNSLVVGNATNMGGNVTPGGSNNITTGTAADAGLDPAGLKNNGGPTQTIALITGSPAIDAGSNALIPSGITTDQRGTGFPRINGGTVDIGAYEAPLPSLSINNASITESDSGSSNLIFTVTLSTASTRAVSVNYATVNGSATAGSDYTSTTGTLSFTAGQTSKTISVPVAGDLLDEINENFFVDLSSPTNATISDGHGIGSILDNDPTPVLSINNITFNETTGPVTNAAFTVTLSTPSGRNVTVNYTTADGTAHAPDDYNARSGTLLFTPGQITKTVSIGVKNDALDEDTETFKVNLSGATGANIATSQGVCTVVDDDTSKISINDVTIVENDSGPKNMKFTVSLSTPNSRKVMVAYATADNTAKAGSDYVATNGTVIFNPGQTIKTFIVQTTGDLLDENNKTYFVNLSNATNAALVDAQGIGTINDDDIAPSLTINDINLVENNSGITNAIFTVTLSAVSGRNVSVNYTTANGTATAGSDYTATGGTLKILAGATTGSIIVPVIGDTLSESDETFKVNLSGAVGANIADLQGVCTILNDDAAMSEPSE